MQQMSFLQSVFHKKFPHSTTGNSSNLRRFPITTATTSGKFAHAQRAASCTQGLVNRVNTNRSPVRLHNWMA
jgi:hypothetical protein